MVSFVEALTAVGYGLLVGTALLVAALAETVLMYRWAGVDLVKSMWKGMRERSQGRSRFLGKGKGCP